MSIKTVIITIALMAIAAPISYFYVKPMEQRHWEQKVQYAEDVIEKPEVLEIPQLQVKTHIEHVGLTENKAMEAPANRNNAAWYSIGYKVGEPGNAVISGHFDNPDGSPALFYHLKDIKVGDFVLVWQGDHSIMFKVREVDTYSVSNFPMQQVFGKIQGRHLNLITCEGDRINGYYNQRLVVYTDAI